MKKKILLGFYLFVSLIAFSENELPYPTNIQSPNASSLGKYGDMQVDFFTGTPNISIPILNIEKKNVKLNISLGYDASGIRVNSHPSWVGQNWTLIAGGVITRTVQTYEDEYPEKSVMTKNCKINKAGFFKTKASDYYCNKNLTVVYANSSEGVSNYDCQPDIFTFNFMGKSGKFFMDNDGNWRVQGEQNIDIVLDISNASNFDYPNLSNFVGDNYNTSGCNPLIMANAPKTICGIKIRDDEGNIYTFGYKKTAIEYSIDFFHQNYNGATSNNYMPAKWIANAWYLSQINDKFGNLIFSFNYERGQYIADFFEYFQKTTVNANGQMSAQDAFVAKAEQYGQWGGNLISPVYLTEIRTEEQGGKVIRFSSSESFERPYKYSTPLNFNGVLIPTETFPIGTVGDEMYRLTLGNGFERFPILCSTFWDAENRPTLGLSWRKLDNIAYFDANAFVSIKNFKFLYNNGIENDSERLFLTEVDLQEGGEIQATQRRLEGFYSFEYNYPDFSISSNSNTYSLPGYISNKVDHWGYYNGSSNGAYYGNLDRETNETYAKIGILKKITYPTGGYSEFNFESNQATQVVSTTDNELLENRYGNINVGGLRIKDITNFDGIGYVKRSFFYGNSPIPNDINLININGILATKPIYEFTYHPIIYNYPATLVRKSRNPIIPLSNYFGSHIEYPIVFESCEKNNNEDSRTYFKYIYSSLYDIKDEGANYSFISPIIVYSNFGYRRGKLKERSCYDKNGICIEKSSYSYQDEQSTMFNRIKSCNYGYEFMNPGYVTRVDNNNQFFEDPICLGVFFGNIYDIYWGGCKPIQEVNVKYTSNGPVTIKKNYYYQKLEPNNTIDYLASERLLTPDGVEYFKKYKYPWDFPNNSTMNSLYNAFRIQPIEMVTYIDKTPTLANYSIVPGIQDNNQPIVDNDNICLGKEKTTYKLYNNLLVPDIYLKSDNSLNYKTVLTYNNYDEEGNLTCFTNKSGLATSIIWDKSVCKPSLIVENIKYEDLVNIIQSTGVEAFHYTYGNTNSASINVALSSLRNSSNQKYKVSNYFYTPSGNIDSQYSQNSSGFKYEYDSFDRLSRVLTENNKPIQQYQYNYKPTSY